MLGGKNIVEDLCSFIDIGMEISASEMISNAMYRTKMLYVLDMIHYLFRSLFKPETAADCSMAYPSDHLYALGKCIHLWRSRHSVVLPLFETIHLHIHCTALDYYLTSQMEACIALRDSLVDASDIPYDIQLEICGNVFGDELVHFLYYYKGSDDLPPPNPK